MIDSHNPYIRKSGSPALVWSVVVFIDILGYKNLVKEAHEKGESQDFLNKLYGVLVDAVKFLKDEPAKLLLPSLLEKDFYKIRTFTDNIVIGYPIVEDAEREFRAIFSKLSFFQMTMVNAGFFIRGAISIGDLYMDEFAIFGQGLTDAY